jgi:2',3'-cyclic-nucleotide 2'-phosphodiesterase/3'-nucleotidase
MKNKNDHLLKLKKDDNNKYILENKYFNLSSADGIDYFIDVTKPDENKVRILGFANGNRFYADSIYSVAVNSYRGNGGGGHLTEGVGLSKDELKNRIINTTEYDIRFLIMKWIESHGKIKLDNNNNWRVIPEDYFEYGKQKDMRLLFNSKN